MLEACEFSQAVVARLLDFFSDHTSWQRRLWTTGSVLRLREAAEIVDLIDPKGHGVHNLADCKESARDLAKADPGVGSPQERSRLAGILSNEIAPGGAAHLQLRQIALDADEGYLSRWADALEAGEAVGPELISRMLASHLLDGGSSPGHLYRWWQRLARKDRDASYTLVELIRRAEEEIVNQEHEIELMVPFDAFPRTQHRPPGWLEAPEVSAWFTANGYEESIRQVGGMLSSYRARDAGAATEILYEQLETYGARVGVATVPGAWRPSARAWPKGGRQPLVLRRRRRVEIPVLEREGQLFSASRGTTVDSALELAALLDAGTPAAAVAGGWAGLESLLKGPGDGGAHFVAPRLAGLVACAFPRAELTKLAWQRRKARDDAFAEELAGFETNRERCESVATALLDGHSLELSSRSDQAGEDRMRKVLANPRSELQTVRQHAGDAIKRLYRQRNAVLHNGKTDAVALAGTLRVASPLVGAGIDRISHAWFVHGIPALRLAAIADLRLDRLQTPDAPPVTALLE